MDFIYNMHPITIMWIVIAITIGLKLIEGKLNSTTDEEDFDEQGNHALFFLRKINTRHNGKHLVK